MPLLSIQSLNVSRPGGPSLAYPDIHLDLKSHLLLTGPSGCGKSTLLSVIAGLLPPTQGTVTFDGQDFYALDPRARDRLRGQKIGFVFQNLHLVPSLTLEQNIALAASMAEMSLDRDRLKSIISRLGLSGLEQKKPHQLSQGEKQRAAIARAVLNKPSLIVADEPTSSLDDENTQAIITLLKQSADESGAALLIATHDHRLMNHIPDVLDLGHIKKEAAI